MTQPAADPWLTGLTLVAGSRRYPDRHLLYQGVVRASEASLEGRVGDPAVQQVQVEHFAGLDLVEIQVVRLRRGRFVCPLRLRRGHNDLVLGTFDASGRVQGRHVVYRTRAREWAEVFLVALALALVLRAFLAQAFVTPTESMTPTIRRYDRLLIDKMFYRTRGPQYGDLVAFLSPEDSRTFFVKRVIGLPGDRLTTKGPAVTRNGRPLAEAYLAPSPPLREGQFFPTKTWVVPRGAVFLLGDNRMKSRDSRNWGSLPAGRIIGRARVRYWPPHRVGVVE